MSEIDDIRHRIPQLVLGKLSSEEETELRRVISDSEELQEELQLWQGIYRVRRDLPQYDHSDRLAPELLDAFVRGELNPLSAQYSEIQAKIQEDEQLKEDVELLRQALRYVPEESVEVVERESASFLERLFEGKLLNRVLVPVAAVLVVVLGLVFVLSGPGDTPLTARISLKMQNEKRSIPADGGLPELPVILRKGTEQVVFSFPTDRVEVSNFQYDLTLQPSTGESMQLSASALECTEQTLTNLCELTIDDPDILSSLKQGGSFVLEVREEFPENISLVPAEYEYYFRVEVTD